MAVEENSGACGRIMNRVLLRVGDCLYRARVVERAFSPWMGSLRKTAFRTSQCTRDQALALRPTVAF